MFFNIDCYIVNIYEKKIKIHITDEESLLKFQKNIEKLYKTKAGSKVTDVKSAENISTFYLNYSKKTKFEIHNFNYNNIKELIGVNVKISGETKYYSFSVEGTEDKPIFKTGYSLVCNKIYK